MSADMTSSESTAESAGGGDSELHRLLSRCACLRDQSAKLAGELDNLSRRIEDQLSELERPAPKPEETLLKLPRAD